MRYLLDTNMASAAMRGVPAVDDRLRALQPSDWCISAVTRAELQFGVALRPWDAHAADAHGRVRADLRRAGTPIGDFDEMIAAHALALGAVVITDNVRHFERIDGLALENWLRPA